MLVLPPHSASEMSPTAPCQVIGLIRWKEGVPLNSSEIKTCHPLNILTSVPALHAAHCRTGLKDTSCGATFSPTHDRETDPHFGGMKQVWHLPLSLFLNLVHVCLGEYSNLLATKDSV